MSFILNRFLINTKIVLMLCSYSLLHKLLKKSLYSLLESKKITFDLLWALFKSNEIVYAPTYNTEDEPRAFKLDYASLVSTNTHQIYFDALATKLN